MNSFSGNENDLNLFHQLAVGFAERAQALREYCNSALGAQVCTVASRRDPETCLMWPMDTDPLLFLPIPHPLPSSYPPPPQLFDLIYGALRRRVATSAMMAPGPGTAAENVAFRQVGAVLRGVSREVLGAGGMV